ncbi:glycosyltransferase family 4 protein [Salinibacter ruber]|uniref:glycosyltransferase family 4 protein n=1 Tax=Salinibacter ruber TaxID=146919 RepID=UPI001C66F3F1|nr:glycosyltransferase family 4 protein [Salinibacter ruber]
MATVDRIDAAADIIRPSEVGGELALYYSQMAQTLFSGYGELYRRLCQDHYDVLYYTASSSRLGHWKDLVGLWLARDNVETIIAHVHNGNFQKIFDHRPTRTTAQYLENSTDAFLFTHRALSRCAAGAIPPEKRLVVHNTIDASVRCSASEVRAKIERRQSRSTLRILFLGNLIPSKGYRDAVKALTHLSDESREKVRFDLVGAWPDREVRCTFEDWLQARNLQRQVHVHGKVTDRSRIKDFLLDADVFVLPTFYPNEAQPLTIIEAMNAGTPVVSTDHASIPEYIRDGKNGYLVSKKSPPEIASAFEKLQSIDDWTDKARAARETYEETFAARSVRQQLFEAFRKAGVDLSD